MVKTKIIETTEKYDKDGKLVEKTTREETTEDDTDYSRDVFIDGKQLSQAFDNWVNKRDGFSF